MPRVHCRTTIVSVNSRRHQQPTTIGRRIPAHWQRPGPSPTQIQVQSAAKNLARSVSSSQPPMTQPAQRSPQRSAGPNGAPPKKATTHNAPGRLNAPTDRPAQETQGAQRRQHPCANPARSRPSRAAVVAPVARPQAAWQQTQNVPRPGPLTPHPSMKIPLNPAELSSTCSDVPSTQFNASDERNHSMVACLKDG